MRQCGRRRRRIVAHRLLGGLLDLFVDFVRDVLQHTPVHHAFFDQQFGKQQHRVARALGLALGRRTVRPLVVGERMRIRPDHARMHQRRTASLAAVLHGIPHRAIAREKIGAVHLLAEQPRKTRRQRRDTSARRLRFNRNADRVAVVLNQEQHRQARQRSHVQRLPEFAFAGGAVARADQRHFVALRVLIPRGFGAPHRLQKLRAGGRGRTHHVVLAMPPVRRHLPPARRRVRRRAHRLLQHLVRRHPQRETKRAVAVIRIDPIVPAAQRHPGRHLHRLMTGARNLEVDPVLPLQRHFAVVQPPRCVHDAEGTNQLVLRQPRKTFDSGQLLSAGLRGHARSVPPNSSLNLWRRAPPVYLTARSGFKYPARNFQISLRDSLAALVSMRLK